MGLCSGALDANGDGLPAVPSWTMQGNQVGATARSCAASAGDVNGDGYDDLVVGLSGYSRGQQEEGAAVLYLGGPNGLEATPSWAAESNVASAGFGRGVGTAGDLNGDGYDDLVVGAPWRDGALSGAGRRSCTWAAPGAPPSRPTGQPRGTRPSGTSGTPWGLRAT